MQNSTYTSTLSFKCLLLSLLVFVCMPAYLSASDNSGEEYQRVSSQLDSKQSNLKSAEADLTKHYKDIKDLQDKISNSKAKQRKLELQVKKLEVFAEDGGSTEALQRAKYSLRFEQVKQQQLEAEITEKREQTPALEEKQQRLQKTVSSLSTQQKTIYQSDDYQNQLKAEEAEKQRQAEELERQQQLEQQAEIEKQLKAAEKPLTKAEKIYQQKLAKAKEDYLKKKPSPEKALKIRSLIATLQDQPLPADLKAITSAKMKALMPHDEEPYFGYLPKLHLKVDDQEPRVIGYLHYLGNNQYMHTIKLQQGFQDFIIGKWRYSQQILPKYDKKRGVILVDASVEEKPIFSIYPANQKNVDLFSF